VATNATCTSASTDATTLIGVAELESLRQDRAKLDALMVTHDALKLAYEDLRLKVALAQHRLTIAQAEHVDTKQLEIELGHKIAQLDEINRQLGVNSAIAPGDGSPKGEPDDKPKRKPTGRRSLRVIDLPVTEIELPDPDLEGKAERIGFEDTFHLMYKRGGFVRVRIVRIKYRENAATGTQIAATEAVAAAAAAATTAAMAATTAAETAAIAAAAAERAAAKVAAAAADPTVAVGEALIVTAPLPPEILPRSIGTPSLFAHLINEKFCYGMPFHRQAVQAAQLGVSIDRSLMSRWAEQLGATVGATVVHAMRDDAMRTAFCISTDATGILVQPIPSGDKQRRACTRGHFLVQIADRDHVFFEFLAKESSATLGELFRGFTGYVQADAKSVYNFLFRPPDPNEDDPPQAAQCAEVGCWSHLRRKFWETAIVTKDPIAREAILRIKRVFDLDRTWKGKAAAEIKSSRELHIRPHTNAFFTWAADQYEVVKHRRGMLRSAFGYAVRQHGALIRFFDDGRLQLTNNQSERELRRIATGRKAWMFVGSEDHGQAAGNLLTLIASARLHAIDSETYLRDLFRVLPHWPQGRFLELAPKYWVATRARLNPLQLEAELGPLTIPSQLTPTAQ